MTLYQMFEIVKSSYPEINKKMFLSAYNSVMQKIANDIRIESRRTVITTNGNMLYLFNKDNANNGTSEIDMTEISKIRRVDVVNNGNLYRAIYVKNGIVPQGE